MTSHNCSPKNNRQRLSLAFWVSAMLLGVASSASGQEVAPEGAFTITEIAYDDGWQKALRNPSAIFVDSLALEIVVADGGNNRVVIYDDKLRPKFSFEHFVKEPRTGQMIKGEPRDLVVNRSGEIILVDNLSDDIDVLDFRGRLLEQVRLNYLYGDTTLTVKPQSVAIDGDDNLYVATSGDVVTIMVLNNRFDLVRTIGQKGGTPSDFNTPLAVHVQSGRVYVTDLYAKPAVKVFDTSGTYAFGFGGHEIEKADMSFPSGLAVISDSAGEASLWIVDGLRQVIKVFHSEGDFAYLVGGYGVRPGEFRYPADIATLNDSVFYVIERIGGRIQRFDIK